MGICDTLCSAKSSATDGSQMSPRGVWMEQELHELSRATLRMSLLAVVEKLIN